MPFTILAERYERRSTAITSDPDKSSRRHVGEVRPAHRTSPQARVRVLNRAASAAAPRRPSVADRIYDEAVGQALGVLWGAPERICGERLAAVLPVLIPALERHGHLCLDATGGRHHSA